MIEIKVSSHDHNTWEWSLIMREDGINFIGCFQGNATSSDEAFQQAMDTQDSANKWIWDQTQLDLLDEI